MLRIRRIMGNTWRHRIVWIISVVCGLACDTVVMIHDFDTDSVDTATTDAPLTENSVSTVFCDNASGKLVVCDDFEQARPDAIATLNGDVSWVSEPVFDGTQSLLAQTMSAESWACMVYPFTAINSGTIYLSARFFIPADSVAGNITLLNLSGNVDEGSEQTFGVDINVSPERSVDIYIHGNYSRYESTENMVPTGQWFCLNGRYSISEVSGEASVWIDDNLVVSTTASEDAVITGGVSELRIGIGWTENGQDTATVYLDNLKLSTAPVFCD